MIVTLSEAKEYLRVDGDEENSLIETLLKAAQKLCEEVSRREPEEYEKSGAVGKVAVLFALGYFYEHREEANHHELTLRLRNLLFGIRRAAF